MQTKKEIIDILNQERDKVTRNYYAKGLKNMHQDISVDSTLCKTLINYLRMTSDELIEPSVVSNYISKLNKENTIVSLFGGLELRYANERMILEYAEPYFNSKTGSYADGLVQLQIGEEGVCFANYDNAKTSITSDKVIKNMPFDEKRLSVVINYLNEIYQGLKKEENKTK